MNNAGLPNIKLKGKGVMLPPGAKELSPSRQPNEHVFWHTLGGQMLHGVLKEWDNRTAIVEVDGKEVAVPG